jgi:hypothetical protein
MRSKCPAHPILHDFISLEALCSISQQAAFYGEKLRFPRPTHQAGWDHSKDLGTGGKIILERILGKYCGKFWNGCIWLRLGTSGGLCEHGNEPSGSIKKAIWVIISFKRRTLIHGVSYGYYRKAVTYFLSNIIKIFMKQKAKAT